MKISILGAGRVGGTLARALASKHHEVTLGHRDPNVGSARWTGPPVRHATLAEAAAAAPLVIHATPGDTALATLGGPRAELTGKVLVDVANATQRGDNGLPAGLLYPESSLAEQLQATLPGTRVVKALNTMLYSVMADPASLAQAPSAFLSGDDAGAKADVRTLLAALVWPEDRVIDLGPLASARATEALVLMVPLLLQAWGFKPFALTVAY